MASDVQDGGFISKEHNLRILQLYCVLFFLIFFLHSFSVSNTIGFAKTPEIFNAGVSAFFGAKPITPAFLPKNITLVSIDTRQVAKYDQAEFQPATQTDLD
jgi:hypothetical protein